MKRISILVIFIFIATLLVFYFYTQNKEQVFINDEMSSGKIKVAACPTCFELSKKLDSEKYHIIKTNSTAQSIALLESGHVDMILSGRTLKQNEPKLDNVLITEGYSFLSRQEMTIFIDEAGEYVFYSDLNVEILQEKLALENIERVKDVYKYIDEGIIITSWENTDFNKAEIVHLLERTGERVQFSRRPTVYCANVCDEQAQELALRLK